MIIAMIVAKDKDEGIFILLNVLGIKIVMKLNILNFLNIVIKNFCLMKIKYMICYYVIFTSNNLVGNHLYQNKIKKNIHCVVMFVLIKVI